MLTCPHCGEQAVSVWTKMALGPTTSVRCRHCRKPVSVSRWSIALILALFAAMIVLRLFMAASVIYWGFVVLFISICLWGHVKWSPLGKR